MVTVSGRADAGAPRCGAAVGATAGAVPAPAPAPRPCSSATPSAGTAATASRKATCRHCRIRPGHLANATQNLSQLVIRQRHRGHAAMGTANRPRHFRVGVVSHVTENGRSASSGHRGTVTRRAAVLIGAGVGTISRRHLLRLRDRCEKANEKNADHVSHVCSLVYRSENVPDALQAGCAARSRNIERDHKIAGARIYVLGMLLVEVLPSPKSHFHELTSPID